MKQITATITPALVKQELSSILVSDEFRNSPILARFLEFVVLEKVSSRDDEIKEYTIGVRALGRPPDFNPQIDAIVRIHAGRLRRALFHFYNTQGKLDDIIIDIPKGSYVPNFFMRDTEKENHVIDEHFQTPIRQQANRHAPIEDQDKPVLAILPFSNLSSDNSMDYFVLGMGEQITSDMARFQNISVISYLPIKGSKPGIADLKKLRKIAGLDYALMGSVRFMDSAVKLNVQLIQAENGKIAWTETYYRNYTTGNIFEIQEDISDQVLNSIADDNGIICKMGKANPSLHKKPDSSKVQDGIYKYYDYTQNYSSEKFACALDALETAVKIEPNNALANGLLSGLYLDLYATNMNPDYQVLDKAMLLAQTAVTLDEKNQQAYKSLAWGHLFYGNKEVSVQYIEACIRLNPKSASIISAMGLALVCAGEYSKGFQYLLKSKQLNPSIYHTCKLGLAIFYYYSNKLSESLHWLMQMQPLELPFFKLLHLAILGKMNGKIENIDHSISGLKDNSDNIISRLLMDNKIKNEISHGLILAGL